MPFVSTAMMNALLKAKPSRISLPLYCVLSLRQPMVSHCPVTLNGYKRTRISVRTRSCVRRVLILYKICNISANVSLPLKKRLNLWCPRHRCGFLKATTVFFLQALNKEEAVVYPMPVIHQNNTGMHHQVAVGPVLQLLAKMSPGRVSLSTSK